MVGVGCVLCNHSTTPHPTPHRHWLGLTLLSAIWWQCPFPPSPPKITLLQGIPFACATPIKLECVWSAQYIPRCTQLTQSGASMKEASVSASILILKKNIFGEMRFCACCIICLVQAYMTFVTDAADIVRGAKKFMWSNFAEHDKFCLSCGSKLLHMTSNFAPHDTIACHVEQSYHGEQ